MVQTSEEQRQRLEQLLSSAGDRTLSYGAISPGCGSRPIPMEPPRRWPPWVVAAIVFTVAVTVLVAWVIYYLATHGFGE